ncbi:hypothetical protein G9A89_018593 [Geosiphon pyriformis]|nr:hypothetical protein G9A89_018593 [Geosiphon pyriformis]
MKEKKSQHQSLSPLIHYTIKPIIINPSLYVLNMARNCPQWAHAVAMIRNGKLQQSFIATYAFLNALDDQKDKENGTTNLVSHVEPLYQTKKCEMTFLDKKEHATKHAVTG